MGPDSVEAPTAVNNSLLSSLLHDRSAQTAPRADARAVGTFEETRSATRWMLQFGAHAHRMSAPPGQRRSAAWSRSSSACSCAIRVNWMRNSRSAQARRCSTGRRDSAVARRPHRARKAGGGDSERSLSGAMRVISDRGQRMLEVSPMAVLNSTPGRALCSTSCRRRAGHGPSRRVGLGTMPLPSDAGTSRCPFKDIPRSARLVRCRIGGFHE